MINQELKEKAYQLLRDKIDVNSFQYYLFGLVEKTELKSDSLLFELVNINYKREDYRKLLLNLLKEYCSDDELLSLNIYVLCSKLCNSKNDKMSLELINNLSSLYIQDNYDLEVLYEFYILSNEIEAFEYTYYNLTQEEIINKAKNYAVKVISKYNFYRDDDDWEGFFNYKIEREVVIKEPSKKIKYVYIEQQHKSIQKKIIDLLKRVLGLG